MTPTRLLPLLALTTLIAAAAHAQQPEPQLLHRPPDPVPTLKARAKLVIVDVVVTGPNRTPIHDLKKTDFALLEDKHPQNLKAFDEHKALTPTEALKFPQVPALGPGIFTNFAPTPINSAVNVILLDALNTPIADQAYVRSQLLDYLKHERPGSSVAIFGLGTQLHLLQGFTSNHEVLKAVVTKQSYTASPLLDDQVGSGAVPSLSDFASPSSSQVSAGLSSLASITQSFQLQLRAQYTLDAFNILARYLANIPGRKNLIWFSGSFPLDILPDGDAADPFIAVADSEAEYRETTNLLTRSQVAVYPVDARGLQTLPQFSASVSGTRYARNPAALGQDSAKFFQSQALEHDTMNRLAEDTGGEAFYNTNGLSQAVDKAIGEGSNYYTLAYTPTNDKWKGDFRRIAITLPPALAAKGYTLFYRRGYYADDPDSPTSPLASSAPAITPTETPSRRTPLPLARDASKPSPAMLLAMAHGLPQPAEILFKVRVLPASTGTESSVPKDNVVNAPGFEPSKGPYKRYAIDFAAAPADIHFTVTDGIYQAAVEFVALAYTPEGKVVVSTSGVAQTALTAAHFEQITRAGFPFHLELDVPVKGTYTIRTGIHDLSVNTTGAAELPVAAVKDLPPVSPLTQAPPAIAPGK